MPELPDIVVYIEHLEASLIGQRLGRVRLLSPFVLRSVTPPIAAAEGKKVASVRRMGKRIVIAFEGGLFLVLHLMIAGRNTGRSSSRRQERSAVPRSISSKARRRSPRWIRAGSKFWSPAFRSLPRG